MQITERPRMQDHVTDTKTLQNTPSQRYSSPLHQPAHNHSHHPPITHHTLFGRPQVVFCGYGGRVADAVAVDVADADAEATLQT